MKRLWKAAALLLALTLLFSGCSGKGLVITDEETETPLVSLQTETVAGEYPYVPHLTTWEEINAIPVATPDMTEDELRQICVDFATLQQNFYWTPTHDLDYLCDYAGDADKDGKLHCKTGKVYGGLPYGSGALSVYSAMDYYDEETGVLDTSSFTGKTVLTLSNNCGTSIMWGFARISSTVNYHGTISMVVKNGCIPLGPYKYDQNLEKYSDYPTKQICADNGEQILYESYAKLKKADGVVTYGNEAGGHTRMILTDAVVVRNADGSIDGKESYVTSVEQYSTKTNISVNEAMVLQHGEPNKKYSFTEMYQSGYLPFTIPELCGMAKVERAWAKLSCGDSNQFSEVRNSVLESNYALVKVAYRSYDADGNLIEESTRQVANNPVRSYEINVLITAKMEASALAADRVVIETFVASGEKLTVFDGKIV